LIVFDCFFLNPAKKTIKNNQKQSKTIKNNHKPSKPQLWDARSQKNNQKQSKKTIKNNQKQSFENDCFFLNPAKPRAKPRASPAKPKQTLAFRVLRFTVWCLGFRV
jgi:hypothetical protein